MTPLELVHLPALMTLTKGRADVVVGLLDGLVVLDHPDLADSRIREITSGISTKNLIRVDSSARQHGTSVAGILSAARSSVAPGICPDCTLLVCPIFSADAPDQPFPSATAQQLAAAIVTCVDAGARVLNVSAGFAQPSMNSEYELEESLDYAMQRGVIVVAAAGNQGTVGSSAITRHTGVIPVVACNDDGTPVFQSNLGRSIGRRGLGAPGKDVTTLGLGRDPITMAGTSVAAPFVAGAAALLWSLYPTAAAADIRCGIVDGPAGRRRTVTPPLLDALASYRYMATAQAMDRKLVCPP